MDDSKRTALRAATAEVSALEKQIRSLEAAARRAGAEVEEAQAELQRHAKLDAEITRWRVDQMKADKQTKALPEKLKTRVDAKRAASEELEQARSTIAAIETELEEVRAKLIALRKTQALDAAAVLIDIGDVLAAELKAINRRRAEIIQVLKGLASMNLETEDGPLGGIRLSDEAEAAIQIGEPSFLFPGHIRPGPLEEIATRWQQRLSALLADPDAEITAPAHVVPADYIEPPPPAYPGPGQVWPSLGPGSWKPEQATIAAAPRRQLSA